jgi:hypothetical protein
MRVAVAFVLVLGGAGVAIADTPTPPAKTKKAPKTPKSPAGTGARTFTPSDQPEPKDAHKEGEYGGVTPGSKPDLRNQPRPSKGTLSWIGFEAKDGGAQLFFQSGGQFDVVQHVEGATLVAYLSLRQLGHNIWRQIDTRYFDNPLAGVVARNVGAARASKDRPAHGAGIEVRITFKNPKDAREGTMRTATEADGLYYAYMTFPEGAEPSKKPDEPTTSTKDVEQ